MQVKKDYMLSLDVRPGDTIFQYTTVWFSNYCASIKHLY
jgi:hypothetical protein